jgi:hypothetical protein
MATITKDDLFVPELLADAVQGYVAAGVLALYGTGAARVVTGMPDGKTKVGETVKVPYFGSIGEMEDLTNDGDALTPAAFAQTAEQATVKHSGLAFEMTKWAQGNLDDPYGEVARQLVEALRRRIDKALIDAAVANVANEWDTFTHTVAGTPPGNLSYDEFIKARALLGDETGDLAAFVVHSATEAKLYQEKDQQDRPLLIPNAFQGGRPTYLGVPLIVSDRLPFSGTPAIYTSLLLKREALTFWMSNISDNDIQVDKDILKNTDVGALHIYWAAHRYVRMNAMSKPGVVIIKHGNA